MVIAEVADDREGSQDGVLPLGQVVDDHDHEQHDHDRGQHPRHLTAEGREPIGRDTASKLESVTPCLVNRLNTRANSTIG